MNIDEIDKKLNKIKTDLEQNVTEKKIIHNLKKHQLLKNLDEDEIQKVKEEYYSTLSNYEKEYQTKNDQYKDLISRFSKEYLELTEFYVGPELPREHYLQSKKDVIELYKMFAFYALLEPYINAFHGKLNHSS